MTLRRDYAEGDSLNDMEAIKGDEEIDKLPGTAQIEVLFDEDSV